MTKALGKDDAQFMQMCLELAENAEGRTAPNPMVAALVVGTDGQIKGQGFHKASGQAHAEVLALNEAGMAAKGATLYVNLEPCCHFGRTGPCVDKIIESGIASVVAGITDPNPQVSGKGFSALEAKGIEVRQGVLEEECRWLNRGFIKYHTKGLPWVCLKLASTLDGKIADRDGTSRWISGEQARQYVHKLRNVFDCVMVGGATAVKDNPQLNVRDISGGRDPVRAVIDAELFVSPEASICQKDTGGQTIIFTSRKSLARRGQRYPQHVKLIGMETQTILTDEFDLAQVLRLLAEEGVRTVLCEGGSRLAAGLIKNDLVDEVRWIIAPKILGDNKAIPAIGGVGSVPLSECWEFRKTYVGLLGADILIHGVIS